MSIGLVLSPERRITPKRRGVSKKRSPPTKQITSRILIMPSRLAVRASTQTEMCLNFPPQRQKQFRDALQRAIVIDPGYAESYRLLAFINLVNGADLNATVELLKKGLSIRPGDQQFNLLLRASISAAGKVR